MTDAAWDRWVLIAVALIPTATVYVSGRKTRYRIHEQTKQNLVLEKKVDVVHTIANDRLTKALERIEELVLTVQKQQAVIDTTEGGKHG